MALETVFCFPNGFVLADPVSLMMWGIATTWSKILASIPQLCRKELVLVANMRLYGYFYVFRLQQTNLNIRGLVRALLPQQVMCGGPPIGFVSTKFSPC